MEKEKFLNASLLPQRPNVNGVNLPGAQPTEPAPERPPMRGLLHGENDSSSAQKGQRPLFKRVLLRAMMTLAVIGVLGLGYRWWEVGRLIESTDDAYVGGNVTVIAPHVGGFISKLVVDDNQRVQAGDLLIKLDDRDYVAALAKADANVSIQQAALSNLDAQRHEQEAMIAQAEAEIDAADAETVRARDDQARYHHLLETRAASTQNFQQADADYKRAQAGEVKANAALDAAQRQLEVIASQRGIVLATLAAATADRLLARLNLSYTELRAPIDGIVGNRSAQVGAYATAASQLLSLVPAHGLWIDANFKESQLDRIRPGATAFVEVDSIPGSRFRGHVASIAPATGAEFSVLPPENATGNFTKIVQRVPVRIVLDEELPATELLRPGLSVVAKVNTAHSERTTR
jgi:membrane fusion protein (multidrug efflux system)